MSSAFPLISWANGTNIYEVNVRQYTKAGTLRAFMEHIPRLHGMGVEILWLMPITPISILKRQGTFGSYYAASSYTDIDPAYGTEEDFKELIQQCHRLNMKVIIDWVANHTGYDHVWTAQYPHYFKKNEQGEFTGLHGWVDVIDLNYEEPELRQEMIRSMVHWIRTFDIDGFRCDMARTVPIDFWVDARSECDAVKPLFWLAECEILAYHEVFDVTYGWEAMRAFDKYMKGTLALADIFPILNNYAMYPVGSEKLLFTSNHDENTYEGTEYEKYGVHAKALAVFTCTWPGIPLVYSGQEKPNKKRLAFFEKDFIDWDGPVALLDFYTTLLHFRKKNKALQESAAVFLVPVQQTGILMYLCRRENDKVLGIMNLGNERVEAVYDHPAVKGEYTDLFSGDTVRLERKGKLLMEPGAWVVYHVTAVE